MSQITIQPMQPKDAEAVLRIYGEGIATGHATFEERPPDWEEWNAGHLASCRLVAAEGAVEAERAGEGRSLGWAALSPVSGRCVYGGVGEVSVYVSAAARGKGVGRQLLNALILAADQAGLWMLQAGIFSENAASLALHRTAGFREVGTREKLGRMSFGPLAGQWRDVILLERRSPTVGRE